MSERSGQRYSKFGFYFINHIRSLMFSIGEMVRTPLSTLLTLAVIGFAMALPSGLYLVLQNFQSISQNWNGEPTISVFLKDHLSSQQVTQMRNQTRVIKAVQTVQVITPAEGLKTFQQISGLGHVLDHMSKNPLPAVLIVTPTTGQQTPFAMKALEQTLAAMPNVDSVKLDLTWVKRLYNIVTLAERVVYLLSVLFGIGVILVTGNTIRLVMQSHEREIAIMRLLGASSRFIIRPLLYRGFLYGIAGGLIAWILVAMMLWWLSGPASDLAATYGSHLLVDGISFSAGLYIIILSTALSMIGSWLAVTKYLTAKEQV